MKKKKLSKPVAPKQVEKKLPLFKKIQPLLKAKFTKLDFKRIKKLLLMGILIRIKQKKSGRFKSWVRGFPHLQALAQTPVSSYRKLFKVLREKGIYLP